MSALAERVLLSRSGITRLVDRLVAAGMVERSACVTDARGAEAALTARASIGSARRRPPTSTASQRYFLDVVDPDRDRAGHRASAATGSWTSSAATANADPTARSEDA